MEKYGVIYIQTIHHEGDERSRTHPGHGYPAYDEQIPVIASFDTLEQLKNWIKNTREIKCYDKFQAIKYIPLKVSTEVVIEVE